MSTSRLRLPPLEKLSPVLEELAFAGYSRKSVSLAWRMYRKFQAIIVKLSESSTLSESSGENVNAYASFARDFASRDALREIHVTLNDYVAWLDQHRQRLGERLRKICLAGLRRLSACAIASTRWSYGVAFRMALKAHFGSSTQSPTEIAHELVVTLASKVRKGPSWYDPRRESQAGGWFSTWYFRLAQFRVPKDTFRYRPLGEQLEAREEPIIEGLIQSERTTFAEMAASFLDQLPHEESFVIRQWIWNKRSLHDIAAALGTSTQSVCRIRDRALSLLAVLLRSAITPPDHLL